MKNTNHSRRDLLKKGFFATAGAMVLGSLPLKAFAQQGGGASTVQTIATNDPYSVAQGLLNSAMAPMVDGSLPTLQQARIAYLNLATTTAQLKAAAMANGVQVDAVTTLSDGTTVPMYDWSALDYDTFVQNELAILPDVTAMALPPTLPTDFGWDYWLSKLAALFGISDVYKSFLGALEEVGGTLLGQIANAIKNKSWSWLKTLLEQLFNLLKSNRFLQVLIDKIGIAAAERLVGKIIAKCLPIIGWAILVGQMVWTVGEQYYHLIVDSELQLSHA